MRPQRSAIAEFLRAERVRAVPGLRRQIPSVPPGRPPTAERSSDHGINSAQAIPSGRSFRAAYHRSLALLGLMCLLGTADARPMLLPSERFPGPWLEVTQEIRDILTLNKVSACSQAAGRESSRNPGEYLLYCTSDEKLWTSWRVQPAAGTVRGPGRLFQDIALPDGY